MRLSDPFDLERFAAAQAGVYPAALAELRAGAKKSHWMWFVFPQIAGLGRSPTAIHYAIGSIEEARAFLAHPVLGTRLRECVMTLQDLPPTRADTVFGAVDAQKLCSSLTLFAEASGEPLFSAAIARWCGHPDAATIALLRSS